MGRESLDMGNRIRSDQAKHRSSVEESSMNDAIQAYPLQWPAGWRRMPSHQRERSRFGQKEKVYRTNDQGATVHAYDRSKDLSVLDAIERVLESLGRMGLDRDDVVISTNVPTRLDGLPKSNARMPDDPGAAIYWRKGKDTRCMAIDRYDRVQDNIAAIAATLEAMRAIDRHGGASILDRAFQGFTALAAPVSWWQVLELSGPNPTPSQIQDAHARLAMKHHPDRPGGSNEKMAAINAARDQGLEAIV
jgi:hypothetical protein